MKEDMYDNFKKLQNRVIDSLAMTDLIKIQKILSNIDGPTISTGVGGSYVVSTFLSKILSKKNNIICESLTPRDLIYKNLNCYENIIACSYSGNNFGVYTSFNNNLKKYLFSRNTFENVTNIKYKTSDIEHSFISLSSTLIPMTILLAYYLDNDLSIINEILSLTYNFDFENSDIYEILSGYDSNTAHTFIESTMVESGIGTPIIHDKYEFCHGRSTFNLCHSSNLIFFYCNSELDKLYESELNDYYNSIIKINKRFDDELINDYYFTYISMLLCKQIAKSKNKDLSNVNYSKLVKKLYFYKGGM